jgi:hypothetical protein
VTRHGPLVNTFSGEGFKPKVGAAKDLAATSAIVGCFAEKNAALEAAKNAMDRLVEGVESGGKDGAVVIFLPRTSTVYNLPRTDTQ